ncbi:MAG TPA: cyclase family protein [Gammaproteobacteria bacterium]|nr:cyclase family protein [Gammaproteobacteria bacterium]
MPMLIDLSHTVEHGMITYKGLPAPIICDFLEREASKKNYNDETTFQIGKIEMVANTGTYVDAPFHRYEHGKDMSELPLESLVDLEGLVFRAKPGQQALGPELFGNAELRGRAVLVHTGWSRHWGTDRYFEGHPYLTEAAAIRLKDRGAAFVGIDSLNIDGVDTGYRPVHTLLLGAGIPICEHMCNLDALPDRGFRFHAAPVKVKGLGTFPVRAYAMLGT